MVAAYPDPVKEFWIYTLMRFALFVGSLGIVVGVWLLAAGQVQILWAIVIAFLISGLGSYVLLDRQREALARRVQERAETMTTKVEKMRAKEDREDDAD